jgi:hypothetical protein
LIWSAQDGCFVAALKIDARRCGADMTDERLKNGAFYEYQPAGKQGFECLS